MSTLRSNLFDSVYAWILDQGMTPYILVDVSRDSVVVPREHVQDDRIILNIHPKSIDHLSVDGHSVCFSARFNGTSREIQVPLEALMALYTRESNQGIVFQGDSVATELVSDMPTSTEPEKKDQRPQLTLVK